MALADKALLVNLSISQWMGRRLDKGATSTVANLYQTKGASVGNYTKQLLPGAKELAAIHKLVGTMRNYYYEQTLPWLSDGSRILSGKNYVEFTQGFSALKAQFEQAVEAFIKAYPRLRAEAEAELGKLYNANEYPVSLRGLFGCSVDVFPVPSSGDFRVEVSPAEKEAFEKRMAEAERAVAKEAWQRAYETVTKAVGRLSDPEAVFRDSLVENLTDMVSLLPKLNVTEDPNLEAMRRELEKAIVKVTPEKLRNNLTDRATAARELDAISAKMGVFMSGITGSATADMGSIK